MKDAIQLDRLVSAFLAEGWDWHSVEPENDREGRIFCCMTGEAMQYYWYRMENYVLFIGERDET